MFFFSEKSLYFIPKAHPMSKKQWVEWRLSFSLVEKEIFVNLPCLFRKVYLLCKTITTEWKKKYDFPSYILKTIFLWTYENWQKTNKDYTENDLLTMMLDVFSYLLKCYENQNVQMYFIPEQNLLEQHCKSKEQEFLNYLQDEYLVIRRDLLGESQKNLIIKLKELTNLTSLAYFVCEKFEFPFAPIVQSFISDNKCKVINAGEKHPVIAWMVAMDKIIERPSYHDLFYLYTTKILQNRGSFNKEDSMEILCEIYVTLLFTLERIIFCNPFGKDATDPLQHILYFLRLFGSNYFARDSMAIDFIAVYCDVIINFFSVENTILGSFPWEVQRYNMFKKEKETDLRESLLKEFDKKELPKMWLNGDFDNHKISLNYWFKFYRLKLNGNKEDSENLQKAIEENIFWAVDSDFNKLLENINEYFSSNFLDRCLKEIMAAKEAKDHYDGKSFILNYLVDHMSVMYNYGFTAGKFILPTPAVFMSFISQLLLNMQNVDAINDENNQNRSSFSDQNASNICSNSLNEAIDTKNSAKNKWGFTVKKGESYDYVTYDQCKYTTIPFRSTLMKLFGKPQKKISDDGEMLSIEYFDLSEYLNLFRLLESD